MLINSAKTKQVCSASFSPEINLNGDKRLLSFKFHAFNSDNINQHCSLNLSADTKKALQLKYIGAKNKL